MDDRIDREAPAGGAPMSRSAWFMERFADVAPDGNRRAARSMDAATAVEGVLDGLHSQGNAATTYRAMRQWRRMSDPRVLAHTHGVFLDRDRKQPELIVYVDHSVWMYEFNMRKEALLAEWNMLCEGAADLVACSIAFKLSSRARHAGQDGSLLSDDDRGGAEWHESALPALDEQEWIQLEATVAGIHDDRLRQKAQKAIEMSMRRKKAETSQ